MTATEAQPGYGSKISIDGVEIGEVTKIGPPGYSQRTADATHLQSPSAMDEHIVVGVSHQDIAISGNFVPGNAGQAALAAAATDMALHEFILTYPDAVGTTWTFSASVADWKINDTDMTSPLTFDASLKTSGESALGVTYSTGLTTPFFSISESAVIMPDPAQATYEYVATVLTGISSVTVTPTAAAGTITVNGTEVTSGEASDAITLGAAGSVTEITIVVREDNKAARTYTIWVARAAS